MANSAGSSVLADTHALIWYLTDPQMLSTPARQAFEDTIEADGRILTSAVTLIELVYIAEKRSDSIDPETLRELFDAIAATDSPIAVVPVTVDVADRMASIGRHQVRDPFDRAIVATVQVWDARLVTAAGRVGPRPRCQIPAVSILRPGAGSRGPVALRRSSGQGGDTGTGGASPAWLLHSPGTEKVDHAVGSAGSIMTL